MDSESTKCPSLSQVAGCSWRNLPLARYDYSGFRHGRRAASSWSPCVDEGHAPGIQASNRKIAFIFRNHVPCLLRLLTNGWPTGRVL